MSDEDPGTGTSGGAGGRPDVDPRLAMLLAGYAGEPAEALPAPPPDPLPDPLPAPPADPLPAPPADPLPAPPLDPLPAPPANPLPAPPLDPLPAPPANPLPAPPLDPLPADVLPPPALRLASPPIAAAPDLMALLLGPAGEPAVFDPTTVDPELLDRRLAGLPEPVTAVPAPRPSPSLPAQGPPPTPSITQLDVADGASNPAEGVVVTEPPRVAPAEPVPPAGRPAARPTTRAVPDEDLLASLLATPRSRP
jgi:hypothetical protein